MKLTIHHYKCTLCEETHHSKEQMFLTHIAFRTGKQVKKTIIFIQEEHETAYVRPKENL